jgi:hypothetical protein
MNSQLQSFARENLKQRLKECTEAQQHMFKRMYSHDDLERPIDEVVNQMPESTLDWAMDQVRRTIEKNEREAPDAKNS